MQRQIVHWLYQRSLQVGLDLKIGNSSRTPCALNRHSVWWSIPRNVKKWHLGWPIRVLIFSTSFICTPFSKKSISLRFRTWCVFWILRFSRLVKGNFLPLLTYLKGIFLLKKSGCNSFLWSCFSEFMTQFLCISHSDSRIPERQRRFSEIILFRNSHVTYILCRKRTFFVSSLYEIFILTRPFYSTHLHLALLVSWAKFEIF